MVYFFTILALVVLIVALPAMWGINGEKRKDLEDDQ
jgi:hypothetical protein